jgi:hypothetical protein
MGRNVIGEQTVEARLWVDPFKPLERDSRANRSLVANSKSSNLYKQIQNRLDQDHHHGMLILPVMIPGSFYSEVQESRIRSRFAIGSALSQLGYAPNDAESIGSVTLSWPTRERIRDLAKKLNDRSKTNPS